MPNVFGLCHWAGISFRGRFNLETDLDQTTFDKLYNQWIEAEASNCTK